MSNSSYLPDEIFGPAVRGVRGNFDFTLLFENTILAVTPASLFLTAAAFRGRSLHGSSRKVDASWTGINKVAFLAAFAVLQLTILLLWAVDTRLGTTASVPAASLDFIAAIALVFLSYYEHQRNVAPSTLIDTYLFFSLIFDAARLRTLFLMNNLEIRSIAVVFSLSSLIKVGVLFSEAADKRRILLQQYRHLPPESTSGLYSRSVFWWLNPLLKTGFSTVLKLQDLYEIDDQLSSRAVQLRFQQGWRSTNKTRKHALLLTSGSVMKWQLLVSALPRLAVIGFKYSQPFLLQRTISYVSNREDQPANVGWGLVGAYAFVYLALAICTASFEHLLNRCLVTIRGGLVSIIYAKTIDLSITALDESAALTLMSADVERIVESFTYFHDSWGAIVETAIGIWLLYLQLQVACFAPALVFLVAVGGMVGVAVVIPRFQKAWVDGIQTRVAFTSSLLGSMRSVKLLGLSEVVANLVQDLRRKEVALSKRLRGVLLIRIVLQQLPQTVAPFATFVFYVLRANASGKIINASTAFSILSILGLVETPLRMLVVTVPGLVAAISNFGRIQTFLVSTPRHDHRLVGQNMDGPPQHISRTSIRMSAQDIELSEMAPSATGADAFVLKDCAFGWSSEKPAIVHDLNLRIKASSSVMIIGPVGCGKSTMLKGILGETPSSAGFVYASTERVAFADQDPWNCNCSIAENIQGESDRSDVWYNEVIDCCGLRQDLDNLPNGDSTLVGSKGITLSGGQKQRLALARALYSKQDVIILDDVFSGLDPETEDTIFEKLFSRTGVFRRHKITSILVTHAIRRLPYSDHIVSMGPDGTISEQGTYERLRSAGGYVQSLAAQFRSSKKKATEDGESKPVLAPARRQSLDINEAVANMERKTGEWATYRYYLSAAGWPASILSILWTLTFSLTTRAPGLLVTYWTTGAETHGNSMNTLYLGIFGAVSGISVVAIGLTVYYVLLSMVPRSANGLHLSLLKTVMSAPLSFFTKTDSGTTLNRFSQDMTLVDDELPGAWVETVFSGSAMIVTAGLMCATASYFLATVPFVVVALYGIQKFYLRTSRQIRLLDIEAKAPLYSHFQETLTGLASIRAFGWTGAFTEKHLKLLDLSQRPFYILYCIQRWLQVTLDILVAVLVVILMTIVVLLRHEISPGLVGLGLLNIMNFNSTLTQTVKNWTRLETSIGAISRLRDFVRDTECEMKPHEDIEPENGWPTKGVIEIKNFSASYNESSDPVLKDINLEIAPGEKVGICGRSGSGKSSLLASLFHLLEYRNGRIAIDKRDVAYMPRDVLRQRLNVIPQEPYWISNQSVRYNIDPWRNGSSEDGNGAMPPLTDAEIRAALTKCQIWHVVEEKGGLDATMDAEFLSHGQRQLFCLARAILRRGSQVVVLDEISSNVDVKTDELMQAVIRDVFRHCTVVAVAHRLNTIVDFDRIAVLSHGRVVEQGKPDVLLRMEKGVGWFRDLYEI